MRIIVLVILVGASCWAAGAFGTWKMNGARSTFTGGPQPKSLSIRIEPHAKGEVFTVDRIEADGRATSTSTILYLDSRPRPFQDFGCSGTQSSRRVDSETVEILRVCANGEQSRLVWRVATHSKELILEITEQDSAGHRLKRHLVRRTTVSMTAPARFRVPPDIGRGTATTQVSAAWIAGQPVGIPVQ